MLNLFRSTKFRSTLLPKWATLLPNVASTLLLVWTGHNSQLCMLLVVNGDITTAFEIASVLVCKLHMEHRNTPHTTDIKRTEFETHPKLEALT